MSRPLLSTDPEGKPLGQLKQLPPLQTETDKRLENLNKVVRILDPLNMVERERIVNTLIQFYNIHIP